MHLVRPVGESEAPCRDERASEDRVLTHTLATVKLETVVNHPLACTGYLTRGKKQKKID